MVAVIVDHVLVVSEPMAIAHGVVLLLGLVILGGWFFRERGTNRSGTVLGWPGGLRLIALMFAMMIVVVFAIVISAQVFAQQFFFRPLTAEEHHQRLSIPHVGKIYNFGWSRLHSV